MKNLKLSVKLMGGFLFVSLITVIIGFAGWLGLRSVSHDLQEVGEVRLPSILGLEMINEAQTAVAKAERSLLIPQIIMNEADKNLQVRNIDKAWKNAETGFKIYEPLTQTKEEEMLWKTFKPLWETWKKEHENVISLAMAGQS